MSNEQANKINIIKDHLLKIETEGSQINQQTDDFKSETKKALEHFSKNLSNIRSGITSEITRLRTNVDKLSSELDTYKNKTLNLEKTGLGGRMAELLREISTSLQKLQKDMINLSNKQEKEISTIYSQMATKVNTGLEDIYSTQRNQIDNFEKEIVNRLERIQRDIVTTVESEAITHREITNNIASSFEGSLNEFHHRIKEFSNRKETNIDSIFSGTVTSSVGRLEMAKEDLLAGIDGTKNTLEEYISKQKRVNTELEKIIKEKISNSKKELNSQVNSLKNALLNEWITFQEKETTSLSSLKEDTLTQAKKSLETNEEFQKKILGELENTFKTQMFTEIDNISLNFTKYYDSMLGQLDSLINQLKNTRNEMKESLEGTLFSNLNKIGIIGQNIEEELANAFSEVSLNYKDSRENLYSNFSKVLNNNFKQMNQNFLQQNDQLSGKLDKLTKDIDSSLSNFFDSTKQSTSKTIEINDSSLDQLENSITLLFKDLQNGQDKNIETTLTDIRNALRTKQAELVTAISSITPSAEEYIETNRIFIKEKTTDISKQSSAAFEDLKRQVKSIENEGINGISAIVSSTHQRLDDAVKKSGEQSQKLVKELEDSHKSQINNYKGNSNQEITRNLDLINEYQSSSAEKLEKFFDAHQKSLDIFMDANVSRREVTDEIRRNFEAKFDELDKKISNAADNLASNINNNSMNINSSINQVLKTSENLIKKIK